MIFLAAELPINFIVAVGAFGATAITGMASLIAWMIKEEYKRSATRGREDALLVENAALKKELSRMTEKSKSLEDLVEELEHERDYERKRAIEASREINS